MRTHIRGLTCASLAALTALGATSFPGAAEAHGKHKHRHGLTVILGDGHAGYGLGYRSFGCGWLLDRFEATGNPKWYNRWHRCKFGW